MKYYGDEYPEAVTPNGTRQELTHETRFSRYYDTLQVSRFQDGSATIDLAGLVAGWNTWSLMERLELIHGLHWLPRDTEELPDMIRFILYEGRLAEWSALAPLIARSLPQDEAFDQLHAWLQKLNPTDSTNIAQALAMTGHPRAVEVLRQRLDLLWVSETLLDDHPFVNWAGAAAAATVNDLLKLGVPAEELADKIQVLSEHPNEYTRSLGQLLKAGPIPHL